MTGLTRCNGNRTKAWIDKVSVTARYYTLVACEVAVAGAIAYSIYLSQRRTVRV